MKPNVHAVLVPVLAAVLTLATGCAVQDEDQRVEPSTASHPSSQAGALPPALDLDGRLEAAQAISNLRQRDQALAAVALDAAQVGNTSVAEAALSGIADLADSDRACAACARAFAGVGDATQATAIAKRIRSLPTRDQVLAEIAKANR